MAWSRELGEFIQTVGAGRDLEKDSVENEIARVGGARRLSGEALEKYLGGVEGLALGGVVDLVAT
jgi:hypothetical protein